MVILFPLRHSTLEWKCAMEVIASATSNAGAVVPWPKKLYVAEYESATC